MQEDTHNGGARNEILITEENREKWIFVRDPHVVRRFKGSDI